MSSKYNGPDFLDHLQSEGRLERIKSLAEKEVELELSMLENPRGGLFFWLSNLLGLTYRFKPQTGRRYSSVPLVGNRRR